MQTRKRTLVITTAVLIVISQFCACSSLTQSPAADYKDVVLNVINYQEYIDPEMLTEFTNETGIIVKYNEFETPEDMYEEYTSSGESYDLICTSDYMVRKLIEDGDAIELNYSDMPNYKNIDPRFVKLSDSFDPGNKCSLPYFWGTVGILYNKTKVKGPVDSWDVLFNGDYKGQIIMQDSMRDSFMVALKYLGYSMNSKDINEITAAAELLKKQKSDVKDYMVDEARDEVASGEAAMAVVYSGEAYLGNLYNHDLEYVVPKEGSNLWIDSWIITKKCQHPEAARVFLDFLCRKDVAYSNFEYIFYSTPNKAVIKSMDKEHRNNPAIVLPDEALNGCEIYETFDENTSGIYSRLWDEIKAE